MQLLKTQQLVNGRRSSGRQIVLPRAPGSVKPSFTRRCPGVSGTPAGSVLRRWWGDSHVVVGADPPISEFPHQDHEELGPDGAVRHHRQAARQSREAADSASVSAIATSGVMKRSVAIRRVNVLPLNTVLNTASCRSRNASRPWKNMPRTFVKVPSVAKRLANAPASPRAHASSSEARGRSIDSWSADRSLLGIWELSETAGLGRRPTVAAITPRLRRIRPDLSRAAKRGRVPKRLENPNAFSVRGDLTSA